MDGFGFTSNASLKKMVYNIKKMGLTCRLGDHENTLDIVEDENVVLISLSVHEDYRFRINLENSDLPYESRRYLSEDFIREAYRSLIDVEDMLKLPIVFETIDFTNIHRFMGEVEKFKRVEEHTAKMMRSGSMKGYGLIIMDIMGDMGIAYNDHLEKYLWNVPFMTDDTQTIITYCRRLSELTNRLSKIDRTTEEGLKKGLDDIISIYTNIRDIDQDSYPEEWNKDVD